MSDQIPLESLLPAEVVAEIRAIIQRSLAHEPQVSIAGGTSLGLTASVIRPGASGLVQSSMSVTPRLINPAVLSDPVESKKLWGSPLGLLIISIIAQTVLAFYGYHREDLRDASTEKVMQTVVQQVEEFWLAHKEQTQPSPTPTINEMGD
jgi:hypothetical protein